MRLDELREGESGIIEELGGDEGVRRRLSEMGFTKGERVKAGMAFGGTRSYWVMGTLIAIRRATARDIEISAGASEGYPARFD